MASPHIRWTDPSTWPWMVYVCIASALVGWLRPTWKRAWNRLQRKRAESWPVTQGRIEFAILAPDIVRRREALPFAAELDYSYSVAGEREGGQYRREFSTEQEVIEFLSDLKGKLVEVRYDPKKPARSALPETDIDTLLQNRTTATEPE